MTEPLIPSDMENYTELKLHAIEFTKWVSNQKVLDDFWYLSINAQERAYEDFINENNNLRTKKLSSLSKQAQELNLGY